MRELAKAIKGGKAIICPTDTVYGLVCDATNKKAVGKVFKIKNRPRSKSLPVFVKDLKMAREYAFIEKNQEKFLKSVWPGKITVVLRRKPKTKIYGVDKKTIALRVPGHELILKLLQIVNKPLIGTSANLSGNLASGEIKDVLRQFKSRKFQPDSVIDEGILPKSKPSKIIDLTVFPYKTLRQ